MGQALSMSSSRLLELERLLLEEKDKLSSIEVARIIEILHENNELLQKARQEQKHTKLMRKLGVFTEEGANRAIQDYKGPAVEPAAVAD